MRRPLHPDEMMAEHGGQSSAIAIRTAVIALLRRLVWVFAATPVLCATGDITDGATEVQVRAAFLFQLAQYVAWPPDAFASATSPLRFCVLGEDALVPIVENTVRGKAIQGRSIVTARVVTMAQVELCHAVFIGYSGEKKLHAVFSGWAYPPVLLVGQADHFAEVGGMVNLVIESGKVAFEINLPAADRAHLQFRSQLIRLARLVGKKGGPS